MTDAELTEAACVRLLGYVWLRWAAGEDSTRWLGDPARAGPHTAPATGAEPLSPIWSADLPPLDHNFAARCLRAVDGRDRLDVAYRALWKASAYVGGTRWLRFIFTAMPRQLVEACLAATEGAP